MSGEGRLLAVDLGLRTGFALYDRDGRLLRHGSRHFGGRAALRRGAAALLDEHAPLDWLALEGDPRLARAWTRPARARGLRWLTVEPATWRGALLLPRQRQAGRDPKAEAQRLAGQLLAASPASRATAPGPDAAEAILIGRWACREIGWLDADAERAQVDGAGA